MTLQDLQPFVIKREELTRITLVGPVADHKEVLGLLCDSGYNTVRSGAYSDGEMFPRCDTSRYKIIAEIVTKP